LSCFLGQFVVVVAQPANSRQQTGSPKLSHQSNGNLMGKLLIGAWMEIGLFYSLLFSPLFIIIIPPKAV